MSNVVELSIDELKLARIGIRARLQEYEADPSIETAKGVIRVVQKWNHCLKTLGVPNKTRSIWISFDVDCDDSFMGDLGEREEFYLKLADNAVQHLRNAENHRIKSSAK